MAEQEMFSDRAERQLRAEDARIDVLTAEARALGAERERRQLQVIRSQEEALRKDVNLLRSRNGAEASQIRTSADMSLRRWKADIRAIARKLDDLKRGFVDGRRAQVVRLRAQAAQMHERVAGSGAPETAAMHASIERLAARLALTDSDLTQLARVHHTEEWAPTKHRIDREWLALQNERAALENSVQFAMQGPAAAQSAALFDNWWALVLRGLLAFALSTVVLVRPSSDWQSLAALFFAVAAIDGIFQLASALFAPARHERWLGLVAGGFLGLTAAGLIAAGLTTEPFALVTLLGWWAISHGALGMVSSIQLASRFDDDWTLFFEGLAWIAFGVIVTFMSFESPHAIVGLFGAFLYASGGLLFTLGLRMRAIRERVFGRRAGATAVTA